MSAIVKRITHYSKNLLPRVLLVFQLSTESIQLKLRTMVIFSLLLVTHLVILPAHVLGPNIGLRSFQYLSLKIVLFAFSFALLETILINLWVRLLREKSHCRAAPATSGILIGIVSPLLCCTPLLPTVLSFIAILFPSAVSGMGFKIQYTVNVYQTELLLLALGLLFFAVIQNARHLNPENLATKG